MTQDASQRSGIRFTDVRPEQPGTPRTYLLMHGLGGSLEQWHEVQQGLGVFARTIAIDIPGFGQSPMPGRHFDIDAVCAKIVEFCRDLALDDCVLVSHSIGSTVAGRVATLMGSAVRRVIFVSGAMFRASDMAQHPTHFFRNPKLGTAVGIQFLSGSLPVSTTFRRLIVKSPTVRQLALWPFVAHPRTLDPDILSHALTGTGSSTVMKILLHAGSIDYVGIMAAIEQPVDLISGSADRLVGPADIALMRSAVNVVNTHTIPDCGHWPMIEKTSELVTSLRAWGVDG